MNTILIKLITRYLIILFFMYLAYTITRPEYLQVIKGLDSVVGASIYSSVLGVLGWVVKSHLETKPTKDE